MTGPTSARAFEVTVEGPPHSACRERHRWGLPPPQGSDQELGARLVDDVDATIARIVMFPSVSARGVESFDGGGAQQRACTHDLDPQEITVGVEV